MGSEMKKSDTPKVIRTFLADMLRMILTGKPYTDVATFVNKERIRVLKNLSLFSIGVAKQVNDLDKFTAEYNAPGTFTTAKGGKLTIPGHARAACNYNFAVDIFEPNAPLIKSGDKVFVYYLKPNEFDFKAIAIPAESTRFPTWITEHFEIDVKLTEQKMFDSKLEGIFAALKQDVPSPKSVIVNSVFDF